MLGEFTVTQWKYLLETCEYNWSFNKMSIYVKNRMISSILDKGDIELARLLFNQMKNDFAGVEHGIIYWCTFNNEDTEFDGLCDIIEFIIKRFGLHRFDIRTQGKLLRYNIIRGIKYSDLKGVKILFDNDINKRVLKYLFLHYNDVDESNITDEIFVELIQLFKYDERKLKFLFDNLSNKFLLYWSLKLELWDIFNEFILNNNINKQIYSTYEKDALTVLHIVCNTPTSTPKQIRILCDIAFKLITTYYIFIDEETSSGVTPLMFAAQHLNKNLIKLLLNYGADAFKKDEDKNDSTYYIDRVFTNSKAAGEDKIECRDILQSSQNFISKELQNRLNDYEIKFEAFWDNKESDEIKYYTSNNLDETGILQAMKAKKYDDVIELYNMKQYNIDINVITIDGNTLLHYASLYGNPKIQQFLIKNGVYTFPINNDKKYPHELLLENESGLKRREKKIMFQTLIDKDVPIIQKKLEYNDFEKVKDNEKIFLKLFFQCFCCLGIMFTISFIISCYVGDYCQ